MDIVILITLFFIFLFFLVLYIRSLRRWAPNIDEEVSPDIYDDDHLAEIRPREKRVDVTIDDI